MLVIARISLPVSSLPVRARAGSQGNPFALASDREALAVARRQIRGTAVLRK
jgi:hypothetical protein